ncbi:hypothetical protein A7M48_22660 [Acinetobacter baumannii]|nr:hypothetical protein A7M48_22660 [Acinetobacter baumannii]
MAKWEKFEVEGRKDLDRTNETDGKAGRRRFVRAEKENIHKMQTIALCEQTVLNHMQWEANTLFLWPTCSCLNISCLQLRIK